jgi:hypothetical protein
MLNDLMTAFLVAFAVVTTSGLISRIWEYFWATGRWRASMAKSRKPPSPPIPPSQRWMAPLARQIGLKDGIAFHSLGDAARFVPAPPHHYQERNSWRRATELLLEAAERGGSVEAATEQFELALFLEARYVRQ